MLLLHAFVILVGESDNFLNVLSLLPGSSSSGALQQTTLVQCFVGICYSLFLPVQLVFC